MSVQSIPSSPAAQPVNSPYNHLQQQQHHQPTPSTYASIQSPMPVIMNHNSPLSTNMQQTYSPHNPNTLNMSMNSPMASTNSPYQSQQPSYPPSVNSPYNSYYQQHQPYHQPPTPIQSQQSYMSVNSPYNNNNNSGGHYSSQNNSGIASQPPQSPMHSISSLPPPPSVMSSHVGSPASFQ